MSDFIRQAQQGRVPLDGYVDAVPEAQREFARPGDGTGLYTLYTDLLQDLLHRANDERGVQAMPPLLTPENNPMTPVPKYRGI